MYSALNAMRSKAKIYITLATQINIILKKEPHGVLKKLLNLYKWSKKYTLYKADENDFK